MKDISKLFETIMDFKGLSCLVTEKSLIKNQRPVFFLPLLHRNRAVFRSLILKVLFVSLFGMRRPVVCKRNFIIRRIIASEHQVAIARIAGKVFRSLL